MQEIVATESELGRGRRVDLVVRNTGREPIEAADVRWPVSHRPVSRLVEHGWQSWSVVRRCVAGDVRPGRAELPEWVRGTYVADPSWAGRIIGGDQFLVHEHGVAGWLDGRRHLGVVEAAPDGLVAVALLDAVELAPGEERRLDPLWIAEGDPGALYSEYASHWGAEAAARTGARAPLGWCSWYRYFPEVTPSDVRANLAIASTHGIELVQIDDGYQAAIGDWLDPWPGWEEGVAALAADIRAAGPAAGIWTAPFLAGENAKVLAAHPDWPLRHPTLDAPRRAMFNPNNWGGWTFALDTTRPDVLDWLRTTYRALRDAGFDYHKIDFCYAGAMRGGRADRTRTRAEALRLGLEAVREGIGDDGFLLGCGCPFGPAVGVVDAMRVSADVAPDWHPSASWPGYEEGGPAAVNAIQASVLRAPLHRRLWVNDPDCVLLRPTHTGLDAEQRRALADVVAGTGAFTVLSDDLASYGPDEWAEVARLRDVHTAADTPLDLLDPFAPTVVVRSPSLRLDVDFAAGGPVAGGIRFGWP